MIKPGFLMTNDALTTLLGRHLDSKRWNLHRLVYEVSNGCGWTDALDVGVLQTRMRELASAMPAILAEIDKLKPDPRTENTKEVREMDAWGEEFK